MTGRRRPGRRRPWTEAEEAVARDRYPHESTAVLATALGRPVSAVYQWAQRHGIVKSAAYLASPAACRLRRGGGVGAACRFRCGHVPANKGLRRPGWAAGRMRETQFQPGHRGGRAAAIYQPIGTERVSKDGYRERKVNDQLPFQRRWRAVHLLIWEAAHGPVPAGYAVTFINGDKTDVRLENLALIARRDLMARNSIHHLPESLKGTIRALAGLNRSIRSRER